MSNLYETLGILAGILALVGYIPYIYTTIRGKTRPNKATWIIWTVIGGLIAFSYLFEGDKNTIWLPLGYFIGPLVVAILSFRYGYSEWSKLDIACLVVGAISIIPWIISDNAIFTLLINVFIDATGAIPTVVKTYREPETEDFSAWTIFFVANTLELLAIEQWNLAAIYPIYLFILAASIVLFIVKGKLKKQL